MKTITLTWSEPMKQLSIMILAAIFFVSCTPMTTVAKAGAEDDLRIAQQRLDGAVGQRNKVASQALVKSGLDKEFRAILEELKALQDEVAAKHKAFKDEVKAIDVKYKHLGAQQEDIIKKAVSKAKMDKKYKQLDNDVEVALKAVKALRGK
jgi:Skp family chaperone for outer membrane proteins